MDFDEYWSKTISKLVPLTAPPDIVEQFKRICKIVYLDGEAKGIKWTKELLAPPIRTLP